MKEKEKKRCPACGRFLACVPVRDFDGVVCGVQWVCMGERCQARAEAAWCSQDEERARWR